MEEERWGKSGKKRSKQIVLVDAQEEGEDEWGSAGGGGGTERVRRVEEEEGRQTSLMRKCQMNKGNAARPLPA